MLALANKQRRHRLPRLGADDDRPHAGDPDDRSIAASEVEGTSEADNWQNILVKGSSSIRTPADLAGKTIAVNALKGVGEVMIKAALKKVGVDPNSIKLLALPFPAMRSALNNGQVDAIWTPEPFLSQALTTDGARIVMAPGPVLGPLLADRRLRLPRRLGRPQPGPRRRSSARRSTSRSRTRRRTRTRSATLLPAATRNVRLPIWSPVVDRDKLRPAREVREGVRRHLDAAEHDASSSRARSPSGKTLQGDGRRRLHPAAARRQGRDAPEGGQVHVRRHRLVEDAELRARRARA